MTASALAQSFCGPHIAFLHGRVTCPLAGVGTRAANASNRLVVDDPATRVTIDRATITIEDDRACAPKTPIADFVWLAEGPAPFIIHLEVFKSGHAWSIDLHTHEPAPLTERARARYEPFSIVAVDNGRREVLVDHDAIARAIEHVPLARRLSAKLMTTRDHLRDGASTRHRAPSGEARDGAGLFGGVRASTNENTDGAARFDRSIGIGALGRGSFLVRVRLVPLTERGRAPVDDRSSAAIASNAGATSSTAIDRSPSTDAGPPSMPGSLAAMLSRGEWELSIEALTDRYLPEIVARDLRLYGIADLPLLAELAAGRLRKGQTLAFRTTGEVRLDDRIAPLEDARDLARTYIEFHMLGGIIAAALR